MNYLMKKLLVSTAVLSYSVMTGMVAMAADTEIFFRDPPVNSPKPNVLFIMSTAGTMNGAINDADGNGSTKIEVVKDILKDIAATETRINMGLMRYSKPGGPVVFPISDLTAGSTPPASTSFPETFSLNSTIPGGTAVNSAANDAVRKADTTIVDNDPSLILGVTGEIVGIHFPAVNVPFGATVESALIRFTPYDENVYDDEVDPVTPATVATDSQIGDSRLSVVIDSSTNSLDFSTAAGFDFVTRIAAGFTAIPWSPDDWTAAEANDQSSHALDLTTDINTIVQTTGWCGGNAVTVFISEAATGNVAPRAAVSFDTSGSYAPELVLTWTDSSIDSAANEGCYRSIATSTIESGDDDVEDTIKNASTTELGSDNADLDFFDADGNGAAARQVAAVGLLFKNLNIPNGATIDSASIDFVSKDQDDGEFTTAISAISAPNYTTWTDDFSGTETLIGSTDWSIATGADEWTASEPVTTIDISTVVSAMVNLGSWSNDTTNNNIPIVMTGITGDRRVNSYEASPGAPPKLSVTFTGKYAPAAEVAVSNTVRTELAAAIDDFKLVSGQPTADTYLEGYYYYHGDPVNFGGVRGSPTRTTNRVSHPGSHDGIITYGDGSTYGSGVGDAATCLANKEDNTCKDEVVAAAGVARYVPPAMAQCQTNHIIMLTDGFPTAFDGPDAFATVTDNTCSSTDKGEECGEDLARYMSTTDIYPDDTNPSYPDDQLIKTWPIHFGTVNDNKVRFLNAIALAGGAGIEEAFIAENGADLEQVFEDVISSLAKVNTSFVSAGITVNQSNRLTHRDQLYFSLFRPEPFAHWPGNVKRYRIFGSTILDANDNAAIETSSDKFRESSRSFWSASADGNDADLGGAAEQLDFTSATRKVFSNIVDDASGHFSATGNNLVTVANGTANTARWNTFLNVTTTNERDGVLSWIEGTDVDVDSTGTYTVNAGTNHNDIGDPLHSKPTILTYRSSGGIEYDRVFVGTNHGFLHSFDTAANSGEEEWAFIPQELLSNVKDY
ncbi:MAG: type IV pilus assembly protein PilY1, partial [Enterobacterales bacterium]